MTLILIFVVVANSIVLYFIHKNQEIQMATLAELEASVDTLSSTVTTLQTDVAAFVATGATVPQDVIDKLTTLNTTLQAVDASVKPTA